MCWLVSNCAFAYTHECIGIGMGMGMGVSV